MLILDEPTVGVDPLLRQSIWQHLIAMTKTERISVIITTHYIEEARQANVVGLMRNGRILAEDSPDELMHANGLENLEEVFLKLCVTDSSRLAAKLAGAGGRGALESVQALGGSQVSHQADGTRRRRTKRASDADAVDATRRRRQNANSNNRQRATTSTTSVTLNVAEPKSNNQFHSASASSTSSTDLAIMSVPRKRAPIPNTSKLASGATTVRIHTGLNRIELGNPNGAYVNEAIEVFSSEDEDEFDDDDNVHDDDHPICDSLSASSSVSSSIDSVESYLTLQQMHWSARRANVSNLLRLNNGRHLNKGPYLGLDVRSSNKSAAMVASMLRMSANGNDGNLLQWWKTLMAVTWKNYVRLRRNPPVLIFQFMLPAIQVILFCLCIGGEPFDVPVAIVNDEVTPKSSLQFLNGLNKKIIRQIKYDNLSSALDDVKRGKVWGAIHIPDKYSENLQSRLIMGEEVTNETISNGTIQVYPDLTSECLYHIDKI